MGFRGIRHGENLNVWSGIGTLGISHFCVTGFPSIIVNITTAAPRCPLCVIAAFSVCGSASGSHKEKHEVPAEIFDERVSQSTIEKDVHHYDESVLSSSSSNVESCDMWLCEL